MNSKTVHSTNELESELRGLVDAGYSLEQIKVVTLMLPNGLGHYHPAYLIMWEVGK